MNKYTVFYILLLVGLVGCAIGALLLFEHAGEPLSDGLWVSSVFVGVLALACFVGILGTRSMEIERLAAEHRGKMAKAAEQEQTMCKRRNNLFADLVEQMGWAYRTKDPTNEDVRRVREHLFGLVVSALRENAPIGIVIRLGEPGAFRDLVQKAIKSGDLDLTKSEKWPAELAQFALAGNPAIEVVGDKPPV